MDRDACARGLVGEVQVSGPPPRQTAPQGGGDAEEVRTLPGLQGRRPAGAGRASSGPVTGGIVVVTEAVTGVQEVGEVAGEPSVGGAMGFTQAQKSRDIGAPGCGRRWRGQGRGGSGNPSGLRGPGGEGRRGAAGRAATDVVGPPDVRVRRRRPRRPGPRLRLRLDLREGRPEGSEDFQGRGRREASGSRPVRDSGFLGGVAAHRNSVKGNFSVSFSDGTKLQGSGVR